MTIYILYFVLCYTVNFVISRFFLYLKIGTTLKIRYIVLFTISKFAVERGDCMRCTEKEALIIQPLESDV
jgi:hypothetical protein